jgi:hypothetical protein
MVRRVSDTHMSQAHCIHFNKFTHKYNRKGRHFRSNSGSHDMFIFIANIHNQQLKRFTYTQATHVYASKWLRSKANIPSEHSQSITQKDSHVHKFRMYMHPNDWEIRANILHQHTLITSGVDWLSGVNSVVLLAKINACLRKLSIHKRQHRPSELCL